MADIRPLRGLRYNSEKAGSLSNVIAPPYDIIGPEAQVALHEKSPYNVIRLEYGQTSAADNANDNRYTRAKAQLQSWLAEGVLRFDQEPTLYVHEQRFPFRGQTVSRLGLIAGLRLEPWSAGVVLPHEFTLPKPKADRLDLMRACRCNFSSIMVLYEDSELRNRLAQATNGKQPAATAQEDDGQEHLLWPITDKATIEYVNARLANRQVFIADGHHRYETALAYRDEIIASNGKLPADHPANFVLTTLYDFADPGLIVLPTHRMIHNVPQASIDSLIANLERAFTVKRVPLTWVNGQPQTEAIIAEMAKQALENHVFGLYGPEREAVFLVSLSRKRAEELKLTTGGAAAYRQLDVTVLHQAILGKLLDIDQAKVEGESYVTYTRDEQVALAEVAAGRQQLSVLLNATRPEEVRDVALDGDKMPQKSTYFQPKLPTGLVINALFE
jgi:uncharacterized protein (DUF1015 family)